MTAVDLVRPALSVFAGVTGRNLYSLLVSVVGAAVVLFLY